MSTGRVPESGMTLIELAVSIAIVGILSTALFWAGNEISEGQAMRATLSAKSAVRAWRIMAMTDGGADLLVRTSPSSATALTVSALGGDAAPQVYELPDGATLALNGTPVTCIDMDAQGFVAPTISGCAFSGSTTLPWTWEISTDEQNVPFS
ncbi:pilus assembly FimT family protein [Acidithiobacillus ferridurans]|uniref:Type II secretion system protein n=1 Tax=Acidithiobacillus ferridurans TaxID=1232575 RepID=A0A8X8GB92_ACIFI|nr:type II secretion system protein [Acidithiobacillus ferridurans]MBU2717293.1 type II secretion system protein [Acidithiobacillus ferridurans]MBU2721818.1 type II secretion system protein [Acidithiobacillus ferridurans]MBU2726333.1 type II secretion system protein [Acidithiobacillus ferridurans]MDA8375881.1 type II secretion system protein [Planctomycetia bacterium]